MNFINKVLKVFVGDKSQKDIKEVQPIVDKIKKAAGSVSNLTDDELRGRTEAFKKQIQDAIAHISQDINNIKDQIEQTDDINKKEELYLSIDKLNEEAYEISEKVLEEILPEAFAVVKETAKRFAEFENITVTATPYDRELSGTKDFITLDNDKAIWSTSWDAAGKQVRWDMVHYDVQLIGGTVLHQGKAAEMQTGEGKTLVGTLPIYLNALTGNGVHVVTVNDYLAKRDSAWMAPIFQFHGLSVDCIDYHNPTLKHVEAHITQTLLMVRTTNLVSTTYVIICRMLQKI